MNTSHENVIGLLDIFTPANTLETFKEVYLVTPYSGLNLHRILETHALNEDIRQHLMYQLLRGLKYIHSAGIIHRDLKPSNLAVNERCQLKIIDFGLARSTELTMTGYVSTRWYRAPDIILNWMHYTQAADIWSAGCIMAELITRKTLFPGRDNIDQLKRILAVCGPPDDEFVFKNPSQAIQSFILNNSGPSRQNIRDILEGASNAAIDLVQQMLALDPEDRPTAEYALTHPYLSVDADPSNEPTAPLFDESWEDLNISENEWKKMVWQEVVSFTPT